MKNVREGSMTIFLALVMVPFLSFCMVLLEGARTCYFQVKAEQAMELSEFSVLSEYQYELFSRYGVFFIDLDYELGTEHTAVLEKRVETYLHENAQQLKTEQIKTKNYRRASDTGGIPFLKQAVEKMKVKSGYKVFEELLEQGGNPAEEVLDIGELLEQNESEAEELLSGSLDDEGNPLFQISLPNISFPSVEALTESVFGNPEGLSSKTILQEERMLERQLDKGSGIEEEIGALEMQLFHQYLFENFHYYGNQREDEWKETLEYQLEYMIAGEAEDFKNLENMMWRIFLMRAGGNYLFYHQDAKKTAEAEAEAVAIAGISGNAALIRAVRELILISKAIEESVRETKLIFEGEKVPLYTEGAFSGIMMGYEEYLFLFLNTTKTKEKIYRCMDIVEMEVREKSGYENFKLDHCTDYFEVTWNYTFDSLFMSIPWLDGEVYKKEMKRKFYYER